MNKKVQYTLKFTGLAIFLGVSMLKALGVDIFPQMFLIVLGIIAFVSLSIADVLTDSRSLKMKMIEVLVLTVIFLILFGVYLIYT